VLILPPHRIEAKALKILRSEIAFGMFVVAGLSWVRGIWLLALDLPVAAIGLLAI
jgi:hypothetical protein